jgi:hypothetical protein
MSTPIVENVSNAFRFDNSPAQFNIYKKPGLNLIEFPEILCSIGYDVR